MHGTKDNPNLAIWGEFWVGESVKGQTWLGIGGGEVTKCSIKFICGTFGATKLAFLALLVDDIERGESPFRPKSLVFGGDDPLTLSQIHP